MLKARLVDELRKRQADLFALCSRLVQIPSENPPGDTRVLGKSGELTVRRDSSDEEIRKPRGPREPQCAVGSQDDVARLRGNDQFRGGRAILARQLLVGDAGKPAFR